MSTFTATIHEDCEALPELRALLAKQRLEWEEEPTIFNDLPSISIRITGKAIKSKRTIKRRTKAKDKYTSVALPCGSYLWSTPAGEFKASMPYDSKAYEKIRAAVNRDIEYRLRTGKPNGWMS